MMHGIGSQSCRNCQSVLLLGPLAHCLLGVCLPVEGVLALDGQRVRLRVEDPLVEADQAVVAEDQVEVLKRGTHFVTE